MRALRRAGAVRLWAPWVAAVFVWTTIFLAQLAEDLALFGHAVWYHSSEVVGPRGAYWASFLGAFVAAIVVYYLGKAVGRAEVRS